MTSFYCQIQKPKRAKARHGENGNVASQGCVSHNRWRSPHSPPFLCRPSSLLENLRHRPRDPSKQTNRQTRFSHFLVRLLFNFSSFRINQLIFGLNLCCVVCPQVFRRLFSRLRRRSDGFTTSPIRDCGMRGTLLQRSVGGFFVRLCEYLNEN